MKAIHILIVLLVTALLTGCMSTTQPSEEEEKKAIRAVIEKETTSYYKQDFEAWKSTYVNQPYFRLYGYWEGYPDKVRYFNGFDSLREFKKKQFAEDRTIWKGSTEEKFNENFRIYPQVAWYTFEQLSYGKEYKQILGRSLETRILEKHNGEWKIAYLGFHYFPDSTGK